MYTLLIGIEHLMTGIEFSGFENLTIHRDGSTTFRVASFQPFHSIWHRVNSETGRKERIVLHAVHDGSYQLPSPPTTDEVRAICARGGR
jgi:hypothetical protein